MKPRTSELFDFKTSEHFNAHTAEDGAISEILPSSRANRNKLKNNKLQMYH